MTFDTTDTTHANLSDPLDHPVRQVDARLICHGSSSRQTTPPPSGATSPYCPLHQRVASGRRFRRRPYRSAARRAPLRPFQSGSRSCGCTPSRWASTTSRSRTCPRSVRACSTTASATASLFPQRTRLRNEDIVERSAQREVYEGNASRLHERAECEHRSIRRAYTSADR